MRLGGLFLLIGLSLGASTEVGQGLCQELTTTVAAFPIVPKNQVAKLAKMQLSAGYHSRGVVWLGQAKTEAVFDTGATRNAISKDYLLALLKNEATSGCVESLEDLEEPLECHSVDSRKRSLSNRLRS